VRELQIASIWTFIGLIVVGWAKWWKRERLNVIFGRFWKRLKNSSELFRVIWCWGEGWAMFCCKNVIKKL
jgi:hypothetical protein